MMCAVNTVIIVFHIIIRNTVLVYMIILYSCLQDQFVQEWTGTVDL